MAIPFFKKNQPFLDQFSSDRMNELAKGAANGVVAVSGALRMIRQGDGVALHVPPQPFSEPDPFFVSIPYDDSGTWKVRVTIGTLNGGTPVVGDVEGSGGSAMTASTVLTLNTGEPYICLGVKTDLETRAISRLTLQTRADVDPIVDTGARTRIAFIILAELTEGGDPEWVKASQTVVTNLNYFTSGSSDIVWRA